MALNENTYKNDRDRKFHFHVDNYEKKVLYEREDEEYVKEIPVDPNVDALVSKLYELGNSPGLGNWIALIEVAKEAKNK